MVRLSNGHILIALLVFSACGSSESTAPRRSGFIATTTATPTPSPSPTPSPTPTPEALYDFGGMYSNTTIGMGGKPFNNPATGGQSCPPDGYTAHTILGSSGSDWGLFVCLREHQTGRSSFYDFAGMYSVSSSSSGYSGYGNPATTNAESCPGGYAGQQVFGLNGTDYSLFFCFRQHSEGTQGLYGLGGFYGFGNIQNYPNPKTGLQSCPDGYGDRKTFGMDGTDYPLHFCYIAL